MKALSNRVAGWLATVWPHRCHVCGMHGGHLLVCAPCANELPPLTPMHCQVCALPTPGGAICGGCQRRKRHFDATRAAFRYDTPVREMILALKNGHAFALLPFLQEALICAIEDVRADCIVPMPLHVNRLAERGFNQSMELARGVARVMRLPVPAFEVLRDVDTPHQTGLRERERRRNVRGAFRCTRDFGGQHVIVVDDVMTSGATLSEMARTLKLAGAGRVTNLVLARTMRRPSS